MTHHLSTVRTRIAALALFTAAVCLGLSRADDKPAIDFARDVQPILRDHCYRCHDGRKQTAGLRLDVRSRALKGGESGKAAIVAGDAAKSELVRRVTSANDDEAMPKGGPRLTEVQVKTLRDWIT